MSKETLENFLEKEDYDTAKEFGLEGVYFGCPSVRDYTDAVTKSSERVKNDELGNATQNTIETIELILRSKDGGKIDIEKFLDMPANVGQKITIKCNEVLREISGVEDEDTPEKKS